MTVTTSRPTTLPPLTNSAQRSSDAVWPLASGRAFCGRQTHLICAGRERLAVGLDGFRDANRAERHLAFRRRRCRPPSPAVPSGPCGRRQPGPVSPSVPRRSAETPSWSRPRRRELPPEPIASFLPPDSSEGFPMIPGSIIQTMRAYSASRVPPTAEVGAQRLAITISPLKVRMLSVALPSPKVARMLCASRWRPEPRLPRGSRRRSSAGCPTAPSR